MRGLTCEESSELDGCQHVDRVSFRMEIDFLREEERMWTGRVAATLGLARLETLLSWNELPSRTRGAIEIAFDNEYGDIIVEVIAAKICRSVIDIDHEVLSGQ